MTASVAAVCMWSHQGCALRLQGGRRGLTWADLDSAENAVWAPRKRASEEDACCGE